MHPLRVILVRGSPTDLQAFSQNIRSMTKAKVFTPSLGEVVNASMESHIYQACICVFLKVSACGNKCVILSFILRLVKLKNSYGL